MAAPPVGSVTGLSDPWLHHSTHARSREGRPRRPGLLTGASSSSKPSFGDPSGSVGNCSLCWLSQGLLVGTSCSKLQALSGTANAPGRALCPQAPGLCSALRRTVCVSPVEAARGGAGMGPLTCPVVISV